MRIKLIYGSDTGNTELVTEDLVKLLGNVEVTTVADLTPEDWDYDNFILGIPTWYDGELQSDWEEYFEEFKTLDFTGKRVAIFGLGDQLGYEEWFCDGVGILSKVILDINKNQKIDFLIIEHNMEFIMSISDEIIVMAEGKTLVKGSPKDIQKNQKVLDSYLGYGNDE